MFKGGKIRNANEKVFLQAASLQ